MGVALIERHPIPPHKNQGRNGTMPQRKLRFGDHVELETIDGLVTIKDIGDGSLLIEAPASVAIGPVRKRIKSKPRMQPIKRTRVEKPRG